MQLCTVSAHIDKNKPLELSYFTKEEFHNNITAYKVPWKKEGQQEFPIKSCKDLGISDKALKAIQILFPYLDRVFRATGAVFIPQLHSTVGNHLAGLQNLCDEIFSEENKSGLDIAARQDFDRLSKQVRLSLMLHDIPETPGEISTFCQRLPKEGDENTITETKRQELEHKLAEVLIYQALEVAYKREDKFPSHIHEAVTQSQIDVQKETDSAEARYLRVEQCYKAIKTDINFDPSSEFGQDYKQLLDAYYAAEQACEFNGERGIIGAIVKLIDKLESKLHCATVGDYSKFTFKSESILDKEFNQVRTFFAQYHENPLITKIGRTIKKLFGQSLSIFREWDSLNKALEKYLSYLN